MLFLDEVYVERPDKSVRFRWVKAPTNTEVTHLAQTIAHRIGRFLERQGLLSIPGAWLLRMRYNPFYPYLESRVIGWLDQTGRCPTPSWLGTHPWWVVEGPHSPPYIHLCGISIWLAK